MILHIIVILLKSFTGLDIGIIANKTSKSQRTKIANVPILYAKPHVSAKLLANSFP